MPPTDDQTAPPSAAAAASPPPGAPGTSAADPPELAWELDVPLLTNRFILYDMLKVVGLSGLIFYALLAVVLTVADRRVDFKLLGTFGLVSLLVVLGMLGLLILVMGLFFLNRFPMGFRLTPKGAVVESLSRRGQVANRLAVILGGLAGRPGVAGAGLLGMAQEVVAVDWQDVPRVKVHPGPRVISLMNSWRVVLRLYCLPENFAAVLPAVEAWAAAGSRPPAA